MKNHSDFQKKNKKLWLLLSLIFDAIGYLSYAIPFLGDASDLIWAPISGILMMAMYKGNIGKKAGIFNMIEEAIPFFSDWIPTFTITWIYVYLIKKTPKQATYKKTNSANQNTNQTIDSQTTINID